MTALNLQFTDEEMADLRVTAEREGKSLKAVAQGEIEVPEIAAGLRPFAA